MSAVVADTHTMIWYFRNSPKLSTRAGETLDQAIRLGDGVYISAISLVEVLYLVEKGKLPDRAFTQLVEIVSDPNQSIVAVSFDAAIATVMQQIPKAIVPEMPDRIIAATALHLTLPLVSCDHKIQALTNLQTIW